MPVRTLKNISILILLLANLVLALLVFPSRMEARREEDALRKSLSELYAQQEVALDADSIPDTLTLYMLEHSSSGPFRSVLGVPVFSDDSAEGAAVTGTDGLSRVSDNACMTAADALVAFLGARYTLGWVGSAVTSIEQGYVPVDSSSGLRLCPVWQLQTDTGLFRVNGLSGEITKIS